MKKGHTAGAVLGIIMGCLSALSAIMAIIAWIMAATGNMGIGGDFFGGITGNLIGFYMENDAMGHLVFAFVSIFYLLGAWVNIHGGILLKKEKGARGLTIFFGVMNCIGTLIWCIILIMVIVALSRLSEFWGVPDEVMTALIVTLILCVAISVCLVLVAISLFRFSIQLNGDGGTSNFGSDIYGGGFVSSNGSSVSGNDFMQSGYNPIITPTPSDDIYQPNKTVPFDPQNAETPIEPPELKQINPPEPPVSPAPKMGSVKVTEGKVVGNKGYRLKQGYKIVVGKSSQRAQLIIDNQHVSNVHCSIRYNSALDSYIVKDHSTNGTFVHGKRLIKDQAAEFPAGTVLVLADGVAKITLG